MDRKKTPQYPHTPWMPIEKPLPLQTLPFSAQYQGNRNASQKYANKPDTRMLPPREMWNSHSWQNSDVKAEYSQYGYKPQRQWPGQHAHHQVPVYYDPDRSQRQSPRDHGSGDKTTTDDMTSDMQSTLLALAGSLMAQYMVKQSEQKKPPSLLDLPINAPVCETKPPQGRGRGYNSYSAPSQVRQGYGRGSALEYASSSLLGAPPNAPYSSFAGRTSGHHYSHSNDDYADYSNEYQYNSNYSQYGRESQFESGFNAKPVYQHHGKSGWPLKSKEPGTGSQKPNLREKKGNQSITQHQPQADLSREKVMANKWNKGLQRLLYEAQELAALPSQDSQTAAKGMERKPKSRKNPEFPYGCDLCGIQTTSLDNQEMHMNGRKHAQRYLAKQNELGFEEFDRLYSHVPFSIKFQETEGTMFVPEEMLGCARADPTAQWDRFIEYVLQCGRLNNMICKVCIVECNNMQNWWGHLMGNKHLKKCRDLAERIGWEKYNAEYGDIPVIDSAAVKGHSSYWQTERSAPHYGPVGPTRMQQQQIILSLKKVFPHVQERDLMKALRDLQQGVEATATDYSLALQIQGTSMSNLEQTAQVIHILAMLDPILVSSLANQNPAMLQGLLSNTGVVQKPIPQQRSRQKKKTVAQQLQQQSKKEQQQTVKPSKKDGSPANESGVKVNATAKKGNATSAIKKNKTRPIRKDKTSNVKGKEDGKEEANGLSGSDEENEEDLTASGDEEDEQDGSEVERENEEESQEQFGDEQNHKGSQAEKAKNTGQASSESTTCAKEEEDETSMSSDSSTVTKMTKNKKKQGKKK